MKKLHFKIALLVLASLSVIFVLSCSQDTNYELDEISPIDNNELFSKNKRQKGDDMAVYKGGFESWKNQLEYIQKEGGYLGILKANDLKLVSYKVSSEKYVDVKNMNLSLFSKGVIVKDDRTIDDNFVIDNFSSRPALIEIYKRRKDLILTEFEKKHQDNTLKIIELQWDFKGELFSTYCIVSEKFNLVVYDDVLSNISHVVISENIGDLIQNSLPLHTTQSENVPGTSVSYTFTKNLSKTNWVGSTVATANVNLTVTGTVISSTQNAIDSYSSNNYEWASAGYTAKAVTSIVGFTPGSGGSCSFGWAVGVGEGTSLTVSGSGLSITIVGGSMAQNGSAYIIPNHLK